MTRVKALIFAENELIIKTTKEILLSWSIQIRKSDILKVTIKRT